MELSAGKLYHRDRYNMRSVIAHFFERRLRHGNGFPVFGWEPLSLLYKGSPIDWVAIFKYLGTTLADTDVRGVPMEIALANGRWYSKSTAGSTVALPAFRLVHLHQSLSSSLATVNASCLGCFILQFVGLGGWGGFLLRLAPGKPPGQSRTLSLAIAFALSSSVRVGGRAGSGCETFASNARGATGELSRFTRRCLG